MNSPEFDDLEIWRQTIDSLDIDSLPDEPEVPATIPLSELPPSEQARIVWESLDKEDRWWEKYLPYQPDFGPNHITSPEQVKPGMRVLSIITEDAYSQEIIITRTQVKMNEEGELGFSWVSWSDWDNRYEKKEFFGDNNFFSSYGLIPHSKVIPAIENKWAPYNHLCDTGEKISGAQLEELLAHQARTLPSGTTVFQFASKR